MIQSAIILNDNDNIEPKDLPKAMQHPDLLGVGDALPGGSFEDQDAGITGSGWRTEPSRNSTGIRRSRPAVFRSRGDICIALSRSRAMTKRHWRLQHRTNGQVGRNMARSAADSNPAPRSQARRLRKYSPSRAVSVSCFPTPRAQTTLERSISPLRYETHSSTAE